jgi:shikimate kinase / 3-dehydroquinate synthase
VVAPIGPGALGRHLALVGFMGAGKSTVGHGAARLAERPFVDTDAEIERLRGPIPALFEQRGEGEFRRLEEAVVAEALARDEPAVLALGGGAVLSERTRALLRRRAFAVHLLVDVDTAWARVRRSGRPLAQDEESFRRLFAEREALYGEVADGEADDVDGVLASALCVHVRRGALAAVVGAAKGAAVVADERLAGLSWWPEWPEGVAVHALPSGEPAKSLAVVGRLWDELGLGRDGRIVAVGGGTTLDAAGFTAATYLRGVDWIAVPTTLVGQVDAAIGGKTGIDLAKGKNLVGAFHLPAEVAVDPDLLATLPERERRQGMAEVVKTGLLAGRPLWELPEEEMVRACAAFKCAIVLSDPHERGRRAILNLGHTFAHALEAASEYELPHGDAVALGLLAALRLSGQPTDVVEEVLAPRPVEVDREAAWAALGRDKKGRAGRPRLVLLRAPGDPEWGVERPEAETRAALDELIAS